MSSTTVSIVGHGPSLLAREDTGRIIDSSDSVVRMKGAGWELMRELPQSAGSRVTHWGGSYTIREVVRQLALISGTPAWVWVDSRHEAVRIPHDPEVPPCYEGMIIDKPLCDEWDSRYREIMRGCKEAGEHKHTSQGTKAILYACKFLAPDTIQLWGCDNLKSGKSGWSLTRGRGWSYPDHNWQAERALIADIEMAFGVGISFE